MIFIKNKGILIEFPSIVIMFSLMHQLILLKSAERLGATPVDIREVPG
ncbi:MAG: hypothetical protein QG650_825 [Patescibacteria group bacterium]|nr:hypothetical protein [Patescibacteria group bacterium]